MNSSVTAFNSRMDAVAWGGPGPDGRPWWDWKKKGGYGDAGQLLLTYLKVMGFPKDGITKFPNDLCQQGCSTYFGILHTLEWREKYKPWLMTPSAIKENKAGWIYTHGQSVDIGDETGPAIVYFRPGIHKLDNEESYIRALINTLEFAVADTLTRSGNRYGKYNILLDCKNFKT